MRNEETATTTISVIHWGVSKLQCTVSFRRKAAQQLVDYFIYQEKPETFSQTFREPKVLAEHLQTSRQQFQKQFFNSLKEMNAEVTETEAQKLSAELLAQVKKKASYQLVATKELNGQATITFQIKGLDFVTAIEDTTTALLQQTQQATQALDMQHTLAVLKRNPTNQCQP